MFEYRKTAVRILLPKKCGF